MRGEDQRSEGFFSYVRLETRIPADHPLRAIRELVDQALSELSRAFDKLYAREGRPSIPPERLLRALLLQAFFTVRSERQLMEQLNYNLLFRWFVGLSADDPVWDASSFCKNRDRLLDGEIAAKFMTSVLNLPQVRTLLSTEHFSVDGTLIEAWASMKSFVSCASHHGSRARRCGLRCVPMGACCRPSAGERGAVLTSPLPFVVPMDCDMALYRCCAMRSDALAWLLSSKASITATCSARQALARAASG